MKRFRIREDDTVKATAVSDNRKLLSSVYDGGFTTIKEVEAALIRKIPYYSGNKIVISILNIDKDEYKDYTIKVNQ